MILLRTLGEVRIETASGHLSSRRKELSLLAYLARRPRGAAPRAELAALMWHGTDDARARQSLRQALLELKRVVGDGLATEGELVRLDSTTVRLDVTAFEAALAERRPADAVEWWRGDFLAGMDDAGGEGFRTWLEVEREALRRALAAALDGLTRDAAERGDWNEAAGWAQRWTEMLPLDERAHRHLVEALRLAGRPAEARARYAAAVARLRAQLDAEPGPELRQAGARLERGGERALPHRPGSAALFTPDLIGRGPAQAELDAAWASSRSGNLAAVVIEGETGIGKTRLVHEFLRVASGAGDPVVAVRVTADGADTGAGTASALLAALATAPGLGAASPAALATAIALVPGLRSRFPTVAASPGEIPAGDAVAEALTAVAEDRPVIVFVDDLELAGDATLGVLTSAMRKAQGRILLLAALGTDQPPGSSALSALLGAARVRRLKLPPLSATEVEALIASMLVLPLADRHLLAIRLYREGGGNPLYTIELAAALVDEGVLAVSDQGAWQLVHSEGRQSPLPTGLRAILGSRLARLGDAAGKVAVAIAGLPPDAPEGAARAAAALSGDQFDLGRDELIARRLIRLAPGHSGDFQFSHELVRRVVLERAAAARWPAGPTLEAQPAVRPIRRRGLLAVALASAVAVSVFATIRYLAARSVPADPGRHDVVVARPQLEAGATQPESLAALALRLVIDRAAAYRELPAPALSSALARMRSRDTSMPADEATAREVAIRTGTRLVLIPAVSRVSDQLTVSYRLADAEAGQTLKLRETNASLTGPAHRVATSLVKPLEADITDAARRVPARPALPSVTTASLEALRTYASARELLARSDPEWVPLMHRAIELDSGFAAPYGLLAYEYWFTYDQRHAAWYATAGERLARGLPTVERLQVLLDVANAREDWPAAITNARALLDQDSASASKWLTLGQLYYFDAQYSRAVEAYDTATALSAPARPPTIVMNQASVLARVGREREAAALYEEGFAAESSLVRHPFVSHEYGATLVRLGRIADARTAYRRRLDDVPAGRAGGLRSLAMLEAHLGHFLLATELLTDAEAASSASGDTLGMAIAHLLRAEVRMTRGRRDEALADLAIVERTASWRPLPYEVLARGVKLLARGGATPRAEALLRRLEVQTTAVSRGARARVLLARGELLLARGRLQAGRTAVEQALALLPSDDALESAGFAAMAAGAAGAAAARYDSLSARHAIDWDGHAVLELAPYWVARARERAGEPARALAGYQAFLSGWPDADADLPAVIDARRRIAALDRLRR